MKNLLKDDKPEGFVLKGSINIFAIINASRTIVIWQK